MKLTAATSLVAAMAACLPSQAQLAITETLSSESTNLGPTTVTAGPDFWELTNFGTNTVDLTGYIFNDSDATRGGDADSVTLSGVFIAPGESIVLVQSGTTVVTTRDDFINWWGAANLPANLQVLFYTGNGQSSSGDSIVLWSPSATSDADYVDRADFGEAVRGHSFTYNSTNGLFGIISSNGIGGAFKAVTSDDEGSPGTTTGPVPLSITQQPTPSSQTVPAGDNASFTIAARGLPHPHYQWRFKGTPIDGAIQSTLVLTNVQTNDAGAYSVTVDNGVQSILSSNATLIVTTSPVPPTFTTVPVDADAFIGQQVQFSAQVNGSPSPTLQWDKDGVPIPGETSPVLNLNGVQTNDAGLYSLVARSSAGTNSASAQLTVGPKPKLLITELEANEAPGGGHPDWWELTSFDDHPISLRGWRWDDSSHSLAPNNAYTITNDVTIHPGESVVFVENITPDAFRTWWGSNLPPAVQIVTYIGGGLGLSGTSDEVNVWNAVTVQGNELVERIAGVNFAGAAVGATFVYDPENPPISGIMSVTSTNTVKGAAANGVFVAAVSGDVGSPGYVVAPVAVSAAPAGAAVSLQWNAVSGRNYTVQYKTNLSDTSWSTLATLPAGGSTATTSDPMSGMQRFYRVGTVVTFVPEQP